MSWRYYMKKQTQLKPRRNILSRELKGNSEAKLSHAALISEYAFEHGVNLKDRVISIVGDIDEDQFQKVEAAMTLMEAENRTTVTVKINSEGGEVYQAMAIVGRLTSSKCKIITEGYGQIMSAATLILACGDERRISKYSFFMHHESAYEVEGKHSEIKDLVAQSEKEEELWAQWMSEFTEKESSYWKTTGVGKDAYFTAEELVTLGVADEVF